MSEFDLKYGIDVRRKRRYVALMSFAGCLGVVLALVIATTYPQFIPGRTVTFTTGIVHFAYWFCSATGMALYLGYFCFKLLSWIDEPHAIAALRSLMLSSDPYQD